MADLSPTHTLPHDRRRDEPSARLDADSGFYLRWLWANGWSELVGLGGTMLLGFAGSKLLAGRNPSPLAVVVGALAAIALGTLLEGVVVGWAQARVLAIQLPKLPARAWVVATALGALLGLPQWRVLRRQMPRAGGWPGANAVAWMIGMPVVFFGMDLAFKLVGTPLRLLAILATCLIAGLAVGAIHGAVLVRLLRAVE